MSQTSSSGRIVETIRCLYDYRGVPAARKTDHFDLEEPWLKR